MTTLQVTLELPDNLADAANQAGLLKPEALARLLREAVRRQAVDELFAIADQLSADNVPPMTMEEIQQEVDAVRAARQAGAH